MASAFTMTSNFPLNLPQWPITSALEFGPWSLGDDPLCPLLLCYQPAAATLPCFKPHNFSNT